MIDNELIKEITEGITFPVADSLRFWFENCPKFEQFVQREETKIRGRMFQGKGKNKRPKSDDQLSGVVCELWVAYLILSLNARFEVEYEKYGKKEMGPDLTVTVQRYPSEKPTVFNVEVSRFCSTKQEIGCNEVMEELITRIKQIPSDLSFALHTVSAHDILNEWGAKPDFTIRLMAMKEEIFRYIESVILTENHKLPFDTSFEYPIPGFEHELYLTLKKSSKRLQKHSNRKTSCLGGIVPIPYTQNEYENFIRKILKDKLKQMRENEINVLCLISHSRTYDEEDLEEARNFLRNKVFQQDNDFFEEMDIEGGVSDFLQRRKRLSGLVFIDGFTGEAILSCNPQSDRQIPAIIAEYLEKIKEIIDRDKRLNQKMWEACLREKIVSQD